MWIKQRYCNLRCCINFTDETSTTIQVDVLLVYSLEVTCSEAYKSAMKTKLRSYFMHDVFDAWNTVCSTSACENVQISPLCVPASKRIKVAFKIQNLRYDINVLLIVLMSYIKIFTVYDFVMYCPIHFINDYFKYWNVQLLRIWSWLSNLL